MLRVRDMEFWFPLIEDKNLLEVARGKFPSVKNLAEFLLKHVANYVEVVGF